MQKRIISEDLESMMDSKYYEIIKILDKQADNSQKLWKSYETGEDAFYIVSDSNATYIGSVETQDRLNAINKEQIIHVLGRVLFAIKGVERKKETISLEGLDVLNDYSNFSSVRNLPEIYHTNNKKGLF